MIRLAKSCIGDAEKNAVIGVLDREYLGMGGEVQQFEQALSDFFERPSVCVVNGTAALQLSLQAAGIGNGDEVLVQSLTYVASFQAIVATGAKPIACEINPSTLCLDWSTLQKKLTPNTKAIMPVHYSGGVGDLTGIYSFAKDNNLRVIEDAAHAFGSRYKNKRVGGFGDIVCFSFDGIKNITSGEGGCIVTDDKSIIKKASDARLLGVEKDTDKRYSGKRSWQFEATTQGWRYHMSNIMAAIGIEQLKRFDEFALQRQKLAVCYDDQLANLNSVSTLNHNYDEVVPHIYVILLDDRVGRDSIITALGEVGIQVGIHYQPNHLLSLFRKNDVALPITENIANRIMSLPLHPDLSKDDVKCICNTLKAIINGK